MLEGDGNAQRFLSGLFFCTEVEDMSKDPVTGRINVVKMSLLPRSNP